MSLVPPGFSHPFPSVDPGRMARQWQALHAAAAAVEALGNGGAPVGGGGLAAPPCDLPALAQQLLGARRQFVTEGLEDLVAFMEPGLAALLATHERGGDATAPARALLREFLAARAALLALAA